VRGIEGNEDGRWVARLFLVKLLEGREVFVVVVAMRYDLVSVCQPSCALGIC
jgi:hypothetical protein